MRARTTREGRIPGGFGFPLGCVALVVAALAAAVAGAGAHPAYALVAFVPVVLAIGFSTTVFAAAGTAVIAWAVYSGFVLGRAGGLVFDAAAGRAALVLGAALVTGLGGGLLVRAVRNARTHLLGADVPAPRRSVDPPARRAASAAMMRGKPAG
ncbi:hypothetical protein ACFWY9_35895 [Amycolatopsis sp. NPDC059027]|uniref:hypothetical protein n=1 Tax=unclassified Amycolatopsis TaxID=2618356 RepID=UPI003670D4C5